MGFFIAINGRVYADIWQNKNLPRLDIKNNYFDNRDEAWMVSHHLEEYNPMMFYGKPFTKEGLSLYAGGDSAATYRTRK
jgi:hypothetical protein